MKMNYGSLGLRVTRCQTANHSDVIAGKRHLLLMTFSPHDPFSPLHSFFLVLSRKIEIQTTRTCLRVDSTVLQHSRSPTLVLHHSLSLSLSLSLSPCLKLLLSKHLYVKQHFLLYPYPFLKLILLNKLCKVSLLDDLDHFLCRLLLGVEPFASNNAVHSLCETNRRLNSGPEREMNKRYGPDHL